jgi:hypothetical protein
VFEWLATADLQPNHAVVASIPDSAEMPSQAVEPWKMWFAEVADKLFAKVHDKSPIIFYQSDVRHAGGWIDKGFIVQKAAERAGSSLLLHRIVCRKPAGTATFGRATYSHLMLFSKTLRNTQKHGYADVIPDGGPAAWVRGIGLYSCEHIVRMIKQETSCDTLIHVFSGKGLLLEVARKHGLHAIGIDLSKKQCRAAERFDLEKFQSRVGPKTSTSTPGE